ncbi:MAG: DUF21 domain-containing protein [Planctomycetales bacterium]|nr:DUF21 domain-containing protein [Planctomycetales bacterium]
MIAIVLMLLVGVFLSAFFSGSETGMYRATRVRLVIKALGGSYVARGLLWLTNNPSLFVATTLIGNNLANYVVSLAIVLAVQNLFGASAVAELLAPVALAPLLFVYGELLPKNLFYHAPNLLLQRCGPLFLFFTLLFLSIAVLLWLVGRLLESLLGQSPQRVRLALARSELTKMLEEGHQACVLSPAQRRLAQGLFSAANVPVVQYCLPAARLATVRKGASKSEVFRLARRHRLAALAVEDAAPGGRELVGYVRVIDLHLEAGDTVDEVRPLIEIPATLSHVAALIKLETSGELLARVVDAHGATVGLLNVRKLTEPLFRGA